MFEEKNGLEVIVVGKRILIYDDRANKVAQVRIGSYKWEVVMPFPNAN